MFYLLYRKVLKLNSGNTHYCNQWTATITRLVPYHINSQQLFAKVVLFEISKTFTKTNSDSNIPWCPMGVKSAHVIHLGIGLIIVHFNNKYCVKTFTKYDFCECNTSILTSAPASFNWTLISVFLYRLSSLSFSLYNLLCESIPTATQSPLWFLFQHK